MINLKIVKTESHCLKALDDIKKHCYFAFRGTLLEEDLYEDLSYLVSEIPHYRIDRMYKFYEGNKEDSIKDNY